MPSCVRVRRSHASVTSRCLACLRSAVPHSSQGGAVAVYNTRTVTIADATFMSNACGSNCNGGALFIDNFESVVVTSVAALCLQTSLAMWDCLHPASGSGDEAVRCEGPVSAVAPSMKPMQRGGREERCNNKGRTSYCVGFRDDRNGSLGQLGAFVLHHRG